MNCIWICNNYGSIKDAIGRYTFRLVETINNEYDNLFVKVFSGKTVDKSKLQRLYSLEMAHAFNQAISEIKKKRIDIICIEYPFIEWNPIIVYCMKKLSYVARAYNCKVALSVHEYKRSRFIRKKIVDILSSYSDFAFVSDYTNKALLENNIQCYLRSIPSPLQTQQIDISKKLYDKSFIYVGLVNKSKAFYEMLEAFVKFNSDGKKRLYIYTSSEVSIPKEDGIELIKGASDEELVTAFVNSTFCIIPSVPDITLCNGTLKIAALTGCTVVGRVSEEIIKQCDFIVNCSSYSVEDLCLSFQNAYDLDIKKLKDNSVSGNLFGKEYSFSRTAKEIIDVFYKFI